MGNIIEDEQLTLATAFIRQKLHTIKQSAELEQFPGFVEEVLDRFSLQHVVFNRPAQLYRLLEIVRSTYLALREMKNFEAFVLEKYQQFITLAAEKKQHHFIRLNFLYMIAHAYYHNKKFNLALEVMEELKGKMEWYNRKYYRHFLPRYVSLVSTIKSLTGENETAIQMHEAFLSGKEYRLDSQVKLNMQLNLAFFYFNARDYRKANRIFLLNEHSDKWNEKKMGKEWLLRSKLIRVVTQYELAHEEVSLQLIKSIEKDFASFFAVLHYEKAKIFIHYLKQFILDPNAISFEAFRAKAARDLFTDKVEDENLISLAFYCWLKAKLTERDYYTLLLEEVAALAA